MLFTTLQGFRAYLKLTYKLNTKMMKKSDKVLKIDSISHLNNLYLKCKAKHKSTKSDYLTILRQSNPLLLNYTPEDVMDACMDVLCADFENINPTDLQSYLLDMSTSDVHKIKSASSALLCYDAMEEDLVNYSISDTVKMFKEYLKRTVFLLGFLVLGTTTLLAQDGSTCKCGQEKPFTDRIEMYYTDSGLSEATIFVLFENQINKDWGYNLTFQKGDLKKIVNEDLIIIDNFQGSILKVIDNPKNYVNTDNLIKR